ncbi:hypothetical protein TRIP_D420129 [uncultured Paludibacter sp.]|nr:hypothetical protein TRIP_D420129 [uncultured Paludibacter sp.]
METVLQILGVLLLISVFIFLIYHQIRLIYYRHLYTYKKEIRQYLNSKGFKYVNTFYPRNEDWQKSPFNKPPIISVSFIVITPRNFTKTEYLIIIGKTINEKYREFWLEITTTYFSKPILVFRQGQKIKIEQLEEEVTFN